jgi:hypothetical protein
MTATATLATPPPPQPHPTAADQLIAALAATARKPPSPAQDALVQVLAEVLWRKGPTR